MRTGLLLPAVALLALCGCTVGPDYHKPEVHMPEAYQTPAELASRTGAMSPVAPAPVELATWWKSLNDPQLDSLVDRALNSNLDLSMAASRLQAARAEVGVVVSRRLPSAEFSAGLGRGSGTNSTKGRVSPALNSATNTTGLQEITHVVGFDALWEVDLFGRLRRQAEAAMADAQAASDLRNQVLVTLVADVARAYVHVRSLQLRLDVAQRMMSVASKTVDLSHAKFKRGMVNELDAALAERELATVQARIQPLQAELAAAKRTVSLLLGQFPEELNSELGESKPLPAAPAAIDTGLPGELLVRRPDIRQAESELVASNARIGVATAALYPQITLTGGIGYQGQGLGRLPVDWKFIYSGGPSVNWQILDFGGISSLIDAQDYRTQAQLASYRKVVIGAVEEVDNALTNYNAERARLDDLDRAQDAAQRSVDLATKRYDRGLTDFLNVLDAQRQLFDIQDAHAVGEEAAVGEYIALCKALGGGWAGATLATAAAPAAGPASPAPQPVATP